MSDQTQPRAFPRAARLAAEALKALPLHAAAFTALAAISFICSTLLPIRSSALSLAVPLGTALLLTGFFSRIFRGRPARVQGLAVAGLLLVAWGAARTVHSIWRGRFEDLRSQIRAKGHPVSLSDFKDEPLPDDRYLFPGVESVTKGFSAERYQNRPHPGLNVGPWSPEVLKQETDAVEEPAAYLAREIAPRVRQAARLKRLDYVQAARNPLGFEYPRMGDFVAMANTLGLHAVSLAYRGDGRAAWEDVRTILAIERLNAAEHALIGKVRSLFIRRMVARTTVNIQIKSRTGVLPEDVATALARFSSEAVMNDGIRWETAFQMDAHDYFANISYEDTVRTMGVNQDIIMRLWFPMAQSIGILDILGLEVVHRTQQEVLESQGGKGPKGLAESESRLTDDLPIWPYVMSAMALPAYSRYYRAERETHAWARLVLVQSALQRHRARTRRFPESLEKLGPETAPGDLLRDPFTDRPFLYKTDAAGAGYELASVGADGDGLDSRKEKMKIVE